MKLATVQIDGAPAPPPCNKTAWPCCAPGPTWARCCARVSAGRFPAPGRRRRDHVDPNQAVFLSPSIEPPKILCVGLNYADHTKESPYEQPDYRRCSCAWRPAWAPNAIVHRPPSATRWTSRARWSWCGQGRPRHSQGPRAGTRVRLRGRQRDLGTRVPVQVAAMDGRQELRRHRRLGPLRGHGRRAAAGRRGLRLETRLNGVTVQSASTTDMLFDVATVISTVSQAITLQAGDIIFSGTPAGVASAARPSST